MRNNKHTKKVIPISVDNNLNELMEEMFGNKSRYVEWLIYQDLMKHLPENEKLKNIVL